MNDRLPVSVFYIASHEEDRIVESLASVRGWVEEIVVVVSDEADPTLEVARRSGARTFVRNWTGFGAQKRYAEDQCSQRWLFNVDSDEVVSPELKTQLLALFAAGQPPADAYAMPIRVCFPFESRPHRWAYSVSPVRLYERSKARFRDHSVWDRVIPLEDNQPWKTVTLTGDIHHRSYRSLSHYIHKLNYYGDMQSKELHAAGRQPSAPRILLEPLAIFFKSYLARRYFLYGTLGVAYAAVFAVMRMARLAKVRELGRMNEPARPGHHPWNQT